MAWRDVVGLAAVALVVAACAPPASPPPAPTTSTAPERYGAPTVAVPRDGSAFARRPCELLTDRDLSVLGLRGPGAQRTSIDVQECSWRTTNDGRLAMAVNADRDLLADTYRTRLLPIFEPTTVEGMPAVRQRMRRDDNTCTVTTGLGPRQALETEWSGLTSRQTTDPCARAEEAIALVVRKLPPQR